VKKGLWALALTCILLAGAAASGKDMNGKFGVGFDQSFGGVSGLDIKYFLGDIQLSLTPGFEMFKPSGGSAAIAFNIALGGIYNFARSDSANLGFGVRGSLGYQNKYAGDCLSGAIEFPLQAEYFFSDHFAIHGGVAIVITIQGKSGSALTPPNTPGGLAAKNTAGKGVGFGIGNGGFLGNAGFTFYF
jgi:hypothetical protein